MPTLPQFLAESVKKFDEQIGLEVVDGKEIIAVDKYDETKSFMDEIVTAAYHLGEQAKEDRLSKLIEACGTGISDFSLKNSFIGGKYGMHWYATLLTRNEGEKLYQGEGSTPEEAVQNLLTKLKENEK